MGQTITNKAKLAHSYRSLIIFPLNLLVSSPSCSLCLTYSSILDSQSRNRYYRRVLPQSEIVRCRRHSFDMREYSWCCDRYQSRSNHSTSTRLHMHSIGIAYHSPRVDSYWQNFHPPVGGDEMRQWSHDDYIAISHRPTSSNNRVQYKSSQCDSHRTEMRQPNDRQSNITHMQNESATRW